MFPTSLNSYAKYKQSLSVRKCLLHICLQQDNLCKIFLTKHRACFCRAYRVKPKQQFI